MVNPQLLLQSPNIERVDLHLSKALGIAAFTLGVISYQFYRREVMSWQGTKMVALSIMLYHVLIAFVMYSIYTSGDGHIGAMILHLTLAVVIGIFYLQTIGSQPHDTA